MKSRLQLEAAITAVNNRYFKGLNDDDQVSTMIETDKETKGYSFWAGFDSYILLKDEEKITMLADQYGYWSEQVQAFNEVLREKGGEAYKVALNNQYLANQQ